MKHRWHRTCCFFVGVLLMSLGASCVAQPDRWAERDTWQDVPGIVEAMAVAPGRIVADVGARDGYLTVRLAEVVGSSGQVYAVDIDADALRRLRGNLPDSLRDRVTTIHSEPDDPKLPACVLDAAVIVNAYHEFEAYEAMLHHLRAALKPGGRLVLVEPISDRRRDADRARQEASHEIALRYARADLEAAGFRIVEARDPFVARRHRGDAMWLLAAERP